MPGGEVCAGRVRCAGHAPVRVAVRRGLECRGPGRPSRGPRATPVARELPAQSLTDLLRAPLTVQVVLDELAQLGILADLPWLGARAACIGADLGCIWP